MSVSADRNLLFGILALQMDFISRDQLVEAMNAWVLSKQRLLGDLLVERGALATADHALLAPMVERHIARHGGNPAKSLAVLNSVAPAWKGLAGIADADVQASLQQVPGTRQTPGEVEILPTIGGEPPPSLGTRYLIERPHAKGGLGEVFVARDRELNRKVALKHIQDRHADDPASRSLFLLEGEITGALEHPGIIPIYGLGQYPDGRPFYAMRFVQGDSLQAAIDRFHRPIPLSVGEHNVAFRALLGRFLDVCNALAYAHRRGVLHRDLKPGNIMLGEFGETLVIDWGMAKVLKAASAECQPPGATNQTGRDDSPARPMEPLNLAHEALATVGRGAHGTPGYMSPEQAGGRIDELGPATDVYSLGAILFHILVGRPPLSRGDGDILGRTMRGDLPSVRQLRPSVSPSLEVVCHKALALRPAERYPSVQALAADVRQWLADEPVSAWREPRGVRARRWLRKHPRLVAGVGAALLVSLLASLGGSALLDAKNRTLETTNTRLDEALSAEQVQHHRADERTRLANERFMLALEAFKKQVLDAHSLLRKRPGTQDLRKSMMVHAVEGLKKLIREAEKTQEAEHFRVWAYFALGDVYLQIDGNVSKAHREFQLAYDLSQRLAAAAPRDAQAQRDLSVACDNIGDVLLRQGESGKALEQYRVSLKIRQPLADATPRDSQAQHDLSVSCEKIGDVLLQQGDVPRALEQYRAGLKIDQRWAAAAPRDTQAQRSLSLSFGKVGDVLLQQGEAGKALEQYRAGLRISQRLAAADPRNTQAQRELALSFDRIGDVLLLQGDIKNAVKHYREGLKIRQNLANADPRDTQTQRDLSVAYDNIGAVLLRQGEAAKALEQYRAGHLIAQRLAAVDPRDVQAQRDLSVSFERIGNVLLQQGEAGKALEQYRAGLKIAQRLAAADSRDSQAQRDLSVSFQKVGDVLLQQGAVQMALEQYRAGLKIAQSRADADPRDSQGQRDLSVSFTRLGDVLLLQGEVPKALEQYRAGLKIARRRADTDPRNFEAQTDLVVSHYHLGRGVQQTFHHREAAASFEKALAVLRPLQQAGKLKGTPFADWPADIEKELAFCRDALTALGNLDALLKLPPAQAVPLLALRTQLLAQQDKHAEAATAADKLAGLARTGDQHFLAARAFAWCSRDKVNEERFAGRALSCLTRTRNAGFFKDRENIQRLKGYEAFKPLRAREAFKKLLAELEMNH